MNKKKKCFHPEKFRENNTSYCGNGLFTTRANPKTHFYSHIHKSFTAFFWLVAQLIASKIKVQRSSF
jgi:hypothetical protein